MSIHNKRVFFLNVNHLYVLSYVFFSDDSQLFWTQPTHVFAENMAAWNRLLHFIWCSSSQNMEVCAFYIQNLAFLSKVFMKKKHRSLCIFIFFLRMTFFSRKAVVWLRLMAPDTNMRRTRLLLLSTYSNWFRDAMALLYMQNTIEVFKALYRMKSSHIKPQLGRAIITLRFSRKT